MNQNDQEFLARKIRTEYTEKKHTELEKLQELDSRVKRPANVFGYLYGGIAALVMGGGMSLTMTDLGEILGLEDPLVTGIIIGLLGMAMAASTYPIYRKILTGRRKRYAQEILALSGKILED